MTKRNLLFLGAAAIVAAAWYAFRPERLFVDQRAADQVGAAGEVVATGAFHGVAHDGKGTARVVRRQNGALVVELVGFETSNGPDLHLYLVAADDARDSETVQQAGFESLGALKGNVGDQSYEVPAGVDLARFRSVTVWCRRFGVNFATAPLAPPATAAR